MMLRPMEKAPRSLRKIGQVWETGELPFKKIDIYSEGQRKNLHVF